VHGIVGIALVATLAWPQSAVTVPQSPEPGASRPRITDDHIPFGYRRKQQMARYSRRHYGRARWRLRRPPVIVLHFTGGNSYSSAWNHFASNAPARGELPGVCAHFLIGQRGRTGSLVPTTIRCRHAIGLNHRSIGVEMVQATGRGSHWAARQILRRDRQIRPALRLVAYLKTKFDIRIRDVIGHAMANGSRYFRDRQGWRNDHVDWLWREVKVFRRRLKRLLR
jgi:N-acetylmuramoyl-L-alanine amidase